MIDSGASPKGQPQQLQSRSLFADGPNVKKLHCFSEAGTLLITEDKVYVLDTSHTTTEIKYDDVPIPEGGITYCALSSDHEDILIGGAAGSLLWVQLETGKEVGSASLLLSADSNNHIAPTAGRSNAISCISCTTSFTAAVNASTICIFKDKGQLLHTIPSRAAPFTEIVWVTPRTLAASSGCTWHTWRITESHVEKLHDYTTTANNSIAMLAASPDGKHVAAALTNSIINVWNMLQCYPPGGPAIEPSQTFLDEVTGKVNTLTWDPSGRFLAASAGNGINVWSFNHDDGVKNFACIGPSKDCTVTAIAFQPKGHLMAVACDDHTVLLYNTRAFLNSPSQVQNVAYGNLMCGSQGTVCLAWHATNAVFTAASSAGCVVCFEPDAELLRRVNDSYKLRGETGYKNNRSKTATQPHGANQGGGFATNGRLGSGYLPQARERGDRLPQTKGKDRDGDAQHAASASDRHMAGWHTMAPMAGPWTMDHMPYMPYPHAMHGPMGPMAMHGAHYMSPNGASADASSKPKHTQRPNTANAATPTQHRESPRSSGNPPASHAMPMPVPMMMYPQGAGQWPMPYMQWPYYGYYGMQPAVHNAMMPSPSAQPTMLPQMSPAMPAMLPANMRYPPAMYPVPTIPPAMHDTPRSSSSFKSASSTSSKTTPATTNGTAPISPSTVVGSRSSTDRIAPPRQRGPHYSEVGANSGNFAAPPRHASREMTPGAQAIPGAVQMGPLVGKAFTPTPNTVYVGNLALTVDEQVLLAQFCGFGPITHVQLIRDKATNISKGFGFINFSHPTSAHMAMQSMNGMMLMGPFQGRQVKVSPAQQKNIIA